VLLVREDELPRAADVLRTSRPARLPASVALRVAEPASRTPARTRPPAGPDRSRAAAGKAAQPPRSEP
jgi:hypothetical protein